MTSAAPPPSESVDHTPASRTDQLEELRRLLFAREVEELATLRERLEDLRKRAQDVAAVLPQALHAAPDDQLDEALGPTMERALHRSVRKDPKGLADAIFPVLGPAIRKAIAQTLSGMIQAFNKAVEHSLSVHGLKWRFESIRTGVPFGEVVLRHSLVYRVEQVFLIHRETGLPLHHVAIDVAEARDPDMVSGMMTAIQDFASDSFKPEYGSLGTFSVGEVVVKVEQGPRAVIATAIRGHAPNALQTRMQDALETIHLQFGDELARFDGDAAPFDRTQHLLEPLLETQLDEEAPSRRLLSPALIAVLVLLAVALGAWGVLRVRETRRWHRAVDALRAEPGLVVVAAARHRVQGLRDPDARDPAAILAAAGYDSSAVHATWSSFLSFAPPLVVARVTRLLAPPAGVELAYADGVLVGRGEASPAWADSARRAALRVPGVADVDLSAVADGDSVAATAMGADLEDLLVLFAPGSAQLDAQAARTIDSVAGLIGSAAALVAPQRIRLELEGRADRTGDPARNRDLSRLRALTVESVLQRRVGSLGGMTARGLGTADPLAGADSATAATINRSVRVRLSIAGRDGGG